MPKNEIWELFKQAVMEKSELQFNLYSLYSAIKEQEQQEEKESFEENQNQLM